MLLVFNDLRKNEDRKRPACKYPSPHSFDAPKLQRDWFTDVRTA